MGVKRLEDLIAYQRAVALNSAVYALLAASPLAARDLRYRTQLESSSASVSANIAEGWGRFRRKEVGQFLRYAVGSLFETEERVLDGTQRGYFTRAECADVLREIRRCTAATQRFRTALASFDPPEQKRVSSGQPTRLPQREP
jgi:four helix bundle protein